MGEPAGAASGVGEDRRRAKADSARMRVLAGTALAIKCTVAVILFDKRHATLGREGKRQLAIGGRKGEQIGFSEKRLGGR